MNTIIEKIGQFILETIPTIFIFGVVAYIVFGGPMAEFMQIFVTWLYG